ncbi:hypothetical protein HZU77_016440 [Neisseriaceae bacterium TC5R-5]|nr:hypothetical protein [Neisseriaceae bacterium TC5R-5]
MSNDLYNFGQQKRLQSCTAADFNRIQKLQVSETLERLSKVRQPAPEIQRRLVVLRMTNTEKLNVALGHAMARLPGAVAAELNELRQPANLAIIAATLAFWAGSHATPFGYIIDLVMLSGAVLLVGSRAIEAVKGIVLFAASILNANDEHHLILAGSDLAKIISQFGTDVILGVMTKKVAVRARRPGTPDPVPVATAPQRKTTSIPPPKAPEPVPVAKKESEPPKKQESDVKAKKKATLKKNKKNGAQREQEVKKELEDEGHTVLGEQVSIKTPKTRRIVDILVEDGKTKEVRAVEVKSGGAVRSKTQIEKDDAMEKLGGVLIGKNAPADLKNQTLKIPTEVRR